MVSVKEFSLENSDYATIPTPTGIEKLHLYVGKSRGELPNCKTLRSLSFYDWKILNEIPSLAQCPQLTDLRLQLFKINEIKSFLRGASNLTSLSINKITETISVLPENFFQELTSLRYLSLARNYLGSIHSDTFKSQTLLETLDLSYNYFSILDLQLKLTPLRALRTFTIWDNPLVTQYVPEQVNCSIQQFFGNTQPPLERLSTYRTGLPEVCPTLTETLKTLNLNEDEINNEEQALYLHFNYISRITPNTIMKLFDRYPESNMYFAGNPFICDCEAEPLIAALQSHQNQIVDYKRLKCFNIGKTVSNVTLHTLCGPTSEQLGLILATTFIAILIVILLVAKYCHNRQVIKSYLYSRGLCMWFVSEEEEDADCLYDAFISFAHSDDELVAEVLLPQLEREYKLCLHTRDWVPDEIHTQIVRSVEQSRRIIIILSRHFLESIWGITEFRTAYISAMRKSRTRIIMIVVDDDILKNDNLDADISNYLRTNKYIRLKDRWFWKKLHYVLPHQQISTTGKTTNQVSTHPAPQQKLQLRSVSKSQLIS